MCMRELPVTIASPIRSTSPVWTLIGGILIFSERPGLMQILGVIICLIGYFMFFGQKRAFIWKWTIPATGILIAISDFCYFTG
ncbi:MAG: hypothetical protein E7043_07100 [Lentisphaerae bacterium]|nr:hypothetical protein [Lentisphaerota bacterium]